MSKRRILIMDDEELVLDVVSSMLEFMGYEVETSTDGQNAIDRYRSCKEEGRPFDAVILDLTIPGGRGALDVIHEFLRIDPDVRAVVSSGYANDPCMENYARHGFRGAVIKPFKLEDLRDLMKKVLES